MRLGSFTYLLKQGVKNSYLNKAMSLASVAVLTACLVLCGAAYLVSQNIRNIVSFVQQQNEIVVYVKDDLPAGEETLLDKQIRAIPDVIEINYISKEEAFNQQKEKLGNLLDGYEDEDVFPASYHIKVKDLTRLDEDIKALSSLNGVEKVNAATDIADIMLKTDKGISIGGSLVMIVLLAVSVVIIMNTIRITVYTRRREINIMKYVGAANSFIRLPFLVEGIILGIIAALVAFLIVWYGYGRIYAGISQSLSGWLSTAADSLIPFKDTAVSLLIGYTVIGAVIGGFGSVLSVRKHLKV